MANLAFIFNLLLVLVYFTIILGASFYLFGSLIALYFASGVPYVPSYDVDLKLMKEKLEMKPGSTLVDLGCGDGKALRFFVQNFKAKKAVGYDVNLPAIIYGKFINKVQKNDKITLHRSNFLKADIAGYDYVYVYLLSEYLEKIEDFVFSNIGPETIIISNTFKFKKHEPFKVVKNEKGKDRILYYRK